MNRCVVEYFGAANQGVEEAVGPARKMAVAGTINDLGQFVVSCDRCGADFSLTTDVGSLSSMQLLSSPTEADKACTDADPRFKQEGEWVTNLSPKWFVVDLLKEAKTYPADKPPEPAMAAETGEFITMDIELSPDGLEATIDKAAELVARAKRIRESQTTLGTNKVANELTTEALTMTRVLNALAPIPDGSTWNSIISDRADAINGVEPPTAHC